MSKKQREKVEDEVRFHRAQLVRPSGQTTNGGQPPTPTTVASNYPSQTSSETSPDSSVLEQQPQQPSSSSQLVPYNAITNGSVGLSSQIIQIRFNIKNKYKINPYFSLLFKHLFLV